MSFRRLHSFLLLLQFLSPLCYADVFSITSQNQSILSQYRVALVSYSADWCFFSRQLAPIFAEASNNFVEETKNAEVIFGRVDCDAHSDLCASLKITKYPTIKVHKYGVVMRREFRQQRTVEALTQFVKDHAAENITTLDAQGRPAREIIAEHKDSRDMVFGAFHTNDTSDHLLQFFKKGAHLERDTCAFVLVENVNETSSRLFFKDSLTNAIDELQLSDEHDFNHVHSWLTTKCTPVVRELTFANAEDITEEGLPLLILFYDGNSTHFIKRFRALATELPEERKVVNFVTADGHQFTHPLSHMGKSVKDLPMLCIDSFAHMYYHPKPLHEVLSHRDNLAEFIRDLQSGKLHREFHYGPDTTTAQPVRPDQPDRAPDEHEIASKTEPPESVFKHLRPSYLKYTLLHDEL